MKAIKSGKCSVYRTGGYMEVMGMEAGGATPEDRQAVIREIREKLAAISPEAVDLADALHAVMTARTGAELSARTLARKISANGE